MDHTQDSKSWLPKFLRSPNKFSPPNTPPNERSTLLPKPSDHQDISSSASEGETYEVDENTSPPRQWLSEFLLLLRGSVPVIVAYTLQNSLQTASVLVVGRLSPEALATAAFSYMFAMSTAWLIALGGSTALDTLCSSTFTGSKNPHDLGILLQRAFIVLTGFYVPVAILWACSAPVFRLLGQEEYICVDSAKFLTALIPGGLGYIYFESMKKYLQAQGHSSPFHAYPYILLTRHCRNHAPRNLCPPHNLPPQRPP
jgi:MATE family multidrug resistance protein